MCCVASLGALFVLLPWCCLINSVNSKDYMTYFLGKKKAPAGMLEGLPYFLGEKKGPCGHEIGRTRLVFTQNRTILTVFD